MSPALFPALAASVARPGAAPTPRPGPVVPALRDADAGEDPGTWSHVGRWMVGDTEEPPPGVTRWRPWSAPCGCSGMGRRGGDGLVLGYRRRWCAEHARGPAFDWSTATLETP